MLFFQRTAAVCVLILQLFMGMRPAVLLEHVSAPSGHAALATASVPDCHRAADAPASDGDVSHAAHMPVEDSTAPVEHTPSDHAPSHHDGGGCHGAPCCAPVMEGSATLTVVASVALVGFQRPLSGAARIVWVDGARRRPPSTAPPAVTLA
jgi:hypothetical protein